MTINDGGYVFPCPYQALNKGMTLRDYFAAKAMQVFMEQIGCMSDQQYLDSAACGAYRVANAMIAERGKE